MSDLYVPTAVMQATTSEELESFRNRATNWRSEEVGMRAQDLNEAVIAELIVAAKAVEDGTFRRVIEAIQSARSGDIKSIPSFGAAPQVLLAYLRENLIDGWLYKRGSDGHMHPRLVTSIGFVDPPGQGDRYVSIKLTSDMPFKDREGRGDSGPIHDSIHLDRGSVTRKRPDQVLLQNGYVRETTELKAAYEVRVKRFQEVMTNGFAEQFRFTGIPKKNRYQPENHRENRRVVHDVKPSELLPLRDTAPSELAKARKDDEETMLPVPVQTLVRVFDLRAHEFYTANVNDLTDYKYDLTLREKLILPADQRELLDVLTTDLGAFTADMIEGKSAGNVVLAKGMPGVGKTLTAEVYAELIKRPLYSIHSGILGITAKDVRSNLEEAFDLAKRWNAVMLLDEADVFVLARGNDITQNAICAEFLRTLEYFDGLLFMTTNRSDNIDDAIISRCAALIDYTLPSPEDARKIWTVLATGMGVTIPKDVLDDLITALPEASPRDMKMLLRLTLRMAASRGSEMTTEIFARCAMFRGLHFVQKETAR